MAIIAFDLGGTKLSYAVFDSSGRLTKESSTLLPMEKGTAVGTLIEEQARELIAAWRQQDPVSGIGIAIPGVYRSQSGTVWAPNIPGWEDYPLHEQIHRIDPGIETRIDSDRACCILGEVWQGEAQGCTDAIFMTVGTGIGAGILSGGHLIRGISDIAGAIGWMALEPPYRDDYIACGCFEGSASGDGIARSARKLYSETGASSGTAAGISGDPGKASDLFEAYHTGDPLATQVVRKAIQYWGMATANLVSIFNPQKIIFGGGVFGPAAAFIDDIKAEASLWAQPLAIKEVDFTVSRLGGKASLYGAAAMVWNNIGPTQNQSHPGPGQTRPSQQ